MTDDDISFDDLTGPAEATGQAAQPTGGLWVTAPAHNSVELELVAMKWAEPVLQHEPVFLDDQGNFEGTDAAAQAEPENPELAAVCNAIAEHWSMHIALARSLGKGAYWPEYEAACRAEGLQPMNRRIP